MIAVAELKHSTQRRSVRYIARVFHGLIAVAELKRHEELLIDDRNGVFHGLIAVAELKRVRLS